MNRLCSAPDDLKSLLGCNCEKVSMWARLRCNGVMYLVHSTHAGNCETISIPMEILNTGDGTHVVYNLYLIMSPIHFLATHTSQQSSIVQISKPLLKKLTQPGFPAFITVSAANCSTAYRSEQCEYISIIQSINWNCNSTGHYFHETTSTFGTKYL